MRVTYEADLPIAAVRGGISIQPLPFSAQLGCECGIVYVAHVLKWPTTREAVYETLPSECRCGKRLDRSWDNRWSVAWGLDFDGPCGLSYEVSNDEWLAYTERLAQAMTDFSKDDIEAQLRAAGESHD